MCVICIVNAQLSKMLQYIFSNMQAYFPLIYSIQPLNRLSIRNGNQFIDLFGYFFAGNNFVKPQKLDLSTTAIP